MKNTKDNICALIAVRSGSKRVPDKNIRSFADSNLLELKINSIKKTSIDKIYVSSDDDRMLDLATRLGVVAIKRDKYYASDHVPMSEVYVHMAQNLECEHIAYLNVTSPLLLSETLQSCVERYRSLPKEYDSLATVTLIKEYMWMNDVPVNYDPRNHPRSQDLPEIYGVNFAACILPRALMVQNRNIIGNSFFKFETSQEESVDIDTMIDFEIAEFLYKRRLNLGDKGA